MKQVYVKEDTPLDSGPIPISVDAVSFYLQIPYQRAETLVMYLAASEDARRFLATQWPRYSAPLEYTSEELTRLLADLEEAASPPDWAERLAEALHEGRVNSRLMQQWLDAHTEPQETK